MTNGAVQSVSPVPGERELRMILAIALQMPDPAALDADANLVLLGLSSLEIMRMVGHWNKAGIPADFEVLIDVPTLGAWVTYFTELESSR
ncbi:phosphopantetheine-binding protein [Nocardia sp. CA-136227]|uniref:phosphopantetheine-binding protein n=1 Tax=Nocardia sp. CA-136227 TaxID=3239979 RepID=UPI003D96BCDC